MRLRDGDARCTLASPSGPRRAAPRIPVALAASGPIQRGCQVVSRRAEWIDEAQAAATSNPLESGNDLRFLLNAKLQEPHGQIGSREQLNAWMRALLDASGHSEAEERYERKLKLLDPHSSDRDFYRDLLFILDEYLLPSLIRRLTAPRSRKKRAEDMYRDATRRRANGESWKSIQRDYPHVTAESLGSSTRRWQNKKTEQ